MDFIRRHKFTTCVIIIFLIIVIFGVAFLRFLLPNYSGDLYGNRLNGISSYEIDDTKIDEMKEAIGGTEGVVSVDYLLEGKLINITIKVKDEFDKEAAKNLASQTLTYFSDDEKGFYDIQVLISSEDQNSEKYPIIGYKHKTSESLVWSNN